MSSMLGFSFWISGLITLTGGQTHKPYLINRNHDEVDRRERERER